MRAIMAVLGLLWAGSVYAADTVDVLYAGSLVNLMEHGIGPAFEQQSGDHFQGYAGGSKALAAQIKGQLRRGDVFISATPQVNADLTGSANGGWVSWYAVFAQSPLVIGYNPASRFAPAFKSRPWYEVLAEPGIRLGRTDPKLDPKGALTLTLMRQASTAYHLPDLSQRVLGAPDNPAQVLPEETLVGRLQSGELDAGFFYSTETASAHLHAVSLPSDLAPKAVYTVTILRAAAHPQAAERFVAFLLGPQGRGVLEQQGLSLQPPTVSGDVNAVPRALKPLLTATQ